MIKKPPSEARLKAMVKRLHVALNALGDFENMYVGELFNAMHKLDPVSKARFIKDFNALGGRVVL